MEYEGQDRSDLEQLPCLESAFPEIADTQALFGVGLFDGKVFLQPLFDENREGGRSEAENQAREPAYVDKYVRRLSHKRDGGRIGEEDGGINVTASDGVATRLGRDLAEQLHRFLLGVRLKIRKRFYQQADQHCRIQAGLYRESVRE